ncbi:hypothetical protein [Thiohalocapsa marina]|uniref:hypothetical protein n=1 Tax=Thiohalocapsa marina TaxID=424902 RepID=UPI0036DD79FF
MFVVVYIVYMGSLWFAAAASQTFFVFSTPILVFLLAVAYFPPLFINSIVPGNWKALIASVHIFAAFALYPPIANSILDPWYLDAQEQLQLLYQVNRGENDGFRLAASLRDNALDSLERRNPWLYWLSPISLTLLFWALIAYLFFPYERQQGQ